MRPTRNWVSRKAVLGPSQQTREVPAGMTEITSRPSRPAVEFRSMGHTYSSTMTHCVFSTTERRDLIPPELQPELWAYIGGIARSHGMKALAVGGTEDHAHVLLSLPATMPIAKAVQTIKAVSSKWMREDCARRTFGWQEGYGAFSIGVAQAETTIAYIAGQQEHHRRRGFQEEFVSFLKKHQIEYDPRYVWG
jgi:putative transposase